MVERVERAAQSRAYTMYARQGAVDETRLRITEATVRLHERLGPRETTVSAIAEEAGVTRVTVYRHFPDENALVAACAAHWAELHPRPDPSTWLAIGDPTLRLRAALEHTYRWAHDAAPMMTKIYRDVDAMPVFVGQFLADDEKARVAALASAFRARGRAAHRLAGALAHALRIGTWVSLCVDGGLTDLEAIDVMVAAVLAAIQT